MQVVNYDVVGNFASAWQEEGGNSWHEMGLLMLSSAKKALCLLVSPHVSAEEEHDGGQPVNEDPANQPYERGIAKKQLGITIFMAFTSPLLASIISYTIFANTRGYPLVTELSYR